MAFEMKPITTKQSMYCISCGKEHETGVVVPMEFKHFRGAGWKARIVCDGDCLADFREQNASPAEKLLNKFARQFN